MGSGLDKQHIDLSLAAAPTAEELLAYLAASGTIDLDGAKAQMAKSQKEDLLREKHPYKIYKSKDGRWRTYIRDGESSQGRKLIVRTKREALIDTLYKHYLSEDEAVIKRAATLESLHAEWMEYKALHVSEPTCRRVERDWRRYYAESDIVKVPIAQITKLDLDCWVHEMIKKHQMNKHQYVNFRLILRQELDYAVDKGIISKNPFLAVKVDTRRVLMPERKKPDKTQVFSKEELRKLKELARVDFCEKKHPVNQLTPLAVIFMFDVGVRVGEVCALRYEDIIDGSVVVQRSLQNETGEVLNHTKGTYGARVVPLVKEARELIREAQQRQKEEGVNPNGYIFSMTNSPLAYSAVCKAFYTYCRQLGIAAKSSHKARKTFCSTLLADGVGLNTVRQWMGHVDDRTTLANYCYDRSSDDEKLEAMERALSD